MNFFGELIYNDDAEFEIYNDTGIINISKLLESIYEKQGQAYIKVMRANSILFEEDGKVCKKIDKDGINSIHVCGMNLDLVLFENTDEILDIEIRQRGKLKK